MQDTLIQPRSAVGELSSSTQIRVSPWLNWRPKKRRPMPVLSVAELAECNCPELCDRDHANE